MTPRGPQARRAWGHRKGGSATATDAARRGPTARLDQTDPADGVVGAEHAVVTLLAAARKMAAGAGQTPPARSCGSQPRSRSGTGAARANRVGPLSSRHESAVRTSCSDDLGCTAADRPVLLKWPGRWMARTAALDTCSRWPRPGVGEPMGQTMSVPTDRVTRREPQGA